ncbi:MAG: trypsin-like peptidase domain-containing protein [Candidatus Saccharimonadales bacterium]
MFKNTIVNSEKDSRLHRGPFRRPVMPAGSFRLRQRLPLILACLILGIGGGFLGGLLYAGVNVDAPLSTAARQQYVSSESELIASLVDKVGPSVVSINVESEVTAQDVFGFARKLRQQSAGTGFIISSSGVIVTNRHVIPEGTTSVSVTLADGTEYENVGVIGRTSSNTPIDAAFLKVKDTRGRKLTVANLGDSSKIKVGERVIAIGNALGQFQNTVTSGIISGYGRDVTAAGSSGTDIENLTDLFQTDAAINQGNSGGPLVNMNGEVIGINTAVASGAQNIGFAIPVNDVKGLVSSVLSTGTLLQPYLGVRYVSLTDDLAAQYKLSVKRGAYVIPSEGGSSAVLSGSPAAKAGVREGDVITKVNNTVIDDKTNLTNVLYRYKVGDTVTLTVMRGDKHLNVKVTLEEAPEV